MKRIRFEGQDSIIRRSALKRKSEPLKRPKNWNALVKSAQRDLEINKRTIG